VGDPLRSRIPEVLAEVHARLAKESLLLPLGTLYAYGDEGEKTVEALFDGLGGDPVKGFDEGRDNGLVVAARTAQSQVSVFFRPSRLRSETEAKALRELGLRQHGYRIARRWRQGAPALDSAERLLSKGYSALAERVASTPVPEGAYEANPLGSAAELVLEVGKAHDLSEDASVLYLQTLTLIMPTSKAVQRWNGWKPARYKKAAKELAARELCVEAKRARAGRAHFLPGPWEALKAPHPPIESWKLPLYEIDRDAEGGLHPPLGRFLPLRPLHELFAEAWKRIQSGEVPAYEEVR
jgi:hypothetical protein